MLLAATVLSAEEVRCLEACRQRGPHPRMRRRALAVLGHHRGQTLPQLAVLFAVRYATVHGWLQAWNRAGLAGLAEGRRPGRPPKLDATAQKK
jgi:transposase